MAVLLPGRYNFNPHMGVALTGTGPTATDLADRMDQEKEVRGCQQGVGRLGGGRGGRHAVCVGAACVRVEQHERSVLGGMHCVC